MEAVIVDQEELTEYLAGPVVKVVVGVRNEMRPFYVHRELLISRSGFFQKALKKYNAHKVAGGNVQPDEADGDSRWREGRTGTVELPEDDPSVFELYVHLIYYGMIPVRQDPLESAVTGSVADKSQEDIKDDIEDDIEHEQTMIAKLYVFCEKIQDLEGKRTAMSATIECVWTPRPPEHMPHFLLDEVVSIIYYGTVPSDPMRQFIVDCVVKRGEVEWVSSDVSCFHKEYLHDVAFNLLKYRSKPKKAEALDVEDAAQYCEQIKLLDDEAVDATDDRVMTGDDTAMTGDDTAST
ncbi:hypothetical protein OPT61_g7962 [Boeremia exigua]|uniref:Uncharacterized protein n=1 Tax=Boeremia exigua TaxID=749465 RepID=A0ACC2I043_9PLEO|nr:hypothetical protein OPT61_g7962 [Boeremia exigua]